MKKISLILFLFFCASNSVWAAQVPSDYETKKFKFYASFFNVELNPEIGKFGCKLRLQDPVEQTAWDSLVKAISNNKLIKDAIHDMYEKSRSDQSLVKRLYEGAKNKAVALFLYYGGKSSRELITILKLAKSSDFYERNQFWVNSYLTHIERGTEVGLMRLLKMRNRLAGDSTDDKKHIERMITGCEQILKKSTSIRFSKGPQEALTSLKDDVKSKLDKDTDDVLINLVDSEDNVSALENVHLILLSHKFKAELVELFIKENNQKKPSLNLVWKDDDKKNFFNAIKGLLADYLSSRDGKKIQPKWVYNAKTNGWIYEKLEDVMSEFSSLEEDDEGEKRVEDLKSALSLDFCVKNIWLVYKFLSQDRSELLKSCIKNMINKYTKLHESYEARWFFDRRASWDEKNSYKILVILKLIDYGFSRIEPSATSTTQTPTTTQQPVTPPQPRKQQQEQKTLTATATTTPATRLPVTTTQTPQQQPKQAPQPPVTPATPQQQPQVQTPTTPQQPRQQGQKPSTTPVTQTQSLLPQPPVTPAIQQTSTQRQPTPTTQAPVPPTTQTPKPPQQPVTRPPVTATPQSTKKVSTKTQVFYPKSIASVKVDGNELHKLLADCFNKNKVFVARVYDFMDGKEVKQPLTINYDGTKLLNISKSDDNIKLDVKNAMNNIIKTIPLTKDEVRNMLPDKPALKAQIKIAVIAGNGATSNNAWEAVKGYFNSLQAVKDGVLTFNYFGRDKSCAELKNLNVLTGNILSNASEEYFNTLTTVFFDKGYDFIFDVFQITTRLTQDVERYGTQSNYYPKIKSVAVWTANSAPVIAPAFISFEKTGKTRPLVLKQTSSDMQDILDGYVLDPSVPRVADPEVVIR